MSPSLRCLNGLFRARNPFLGTHRSLPAAVPRDGPPVRPPPCRASSSAASAGAALASALSGLEGGARPSQDRLWDMYARAAADPSVLRALGPADLGRLAGWLAGRALGRRRKLARGEIRVGRDKFARECEAMMAEAAGRLGRVAEDAFAAGVELPDEVGTLLARTSEPGLRTHADCEALAGRLARLGLGPSARAVNAMADPLAKRGNYTAVAKLLHERGGEATPHALTILVQAAAAARPAACEELEGYPVGAASAGDLRVDLWTEFRDRGERASRRAPDAPDASADDPAHLIDASPDPLAALRAHLALRPAPTLPSLTAPSALPAHSPASKTLSVLHAASAVPALPDAPLLATALHAFFLRPLPRLASAAVDVFSSDFNVRPGPGVWAQLLHRASRTGELDAAGRALDGLSAASDAPPDARAATMVLAALVMAGRFREAAGVWGGLVDARGGRVAAETVGAYLGAVLATGGDAGAWLAEVAGKGGEVTAGHYNKAVHRLIGMGRAEEARAVFEGMRVPANGTTAATVAKLAGVMKDAWLLDTALRCVPAPMLGADAWAAAGKALSVMGRPGEGGELLLACLQGREADRARLPDGFPLAGVQPPRPHVGVAAAALQIAERVPGEPSEELVRACRAFFEAAGEPGAGGMGIEGLLRLAGMEPWVDRPREQRVEGGKGGERPAREQRGRLHGRGV